MAAPPDAAANASGVLDHALFYARIGWRLLPVNGKKPTLNKWPTAATANELNVRRWFRKGCNIGVATGKGSGIVVIDVDPRNDGGETLERLERDLGPLPRTVTAQTGGGGLHFVFRWFEGAKSTKTVGIDFLADGKMFVAAPSIHPNTGALYEWSVSPFDNEPTDLPEAWQRRFSGTKAYEGAFALPVLQGQRNDYLMSVGGRLRSVGESQASIRSKLLEHNALECDPPLSMSEVEVIAGSVARYAATGKSIKTQWQEAVFDSSLDATTKLILCALSMYADQEGKSCWPTQDDIGKKANCTSRCVREHIQRAEQSGWLRTYRRQRQGKTGFNYGYILQLRPEPHSGS